MTDRAKGNTLTPHGCWASTSRTRLLCGGEACRTHCCCFIHQDADFRLICIPWLVGGVRTVIGLAAGIGAAYVASQLGILRSEVGFYALLAPIRICEWLILFRLFFHRDWDWSRSLKLAAFGAVWSYVLDIPAIMAVFVIPGGAWIC